MKKVKVLLLLGVLLVGVSSCANIFESMDCEEDREKPENFECFKDSNCE